MHPETVCDEPEGYSVINGDCDDSDPLINPDAEERGCNLKDDDCDTSIDEGFSDEDCVGCSIDAEFSYEITPGLFACVNDENITTYEENYAMCAPGATPATWDLVNDLGLRIPTQAEQDTFFAWYQSQATTGDTNYIRRDQTRRGGCTPTAHGDLYVAHFHSLSAPEAGFADLFDRPNGYSCNLTTSSANNVHALAGVLCVRGEYVLPRE